MGMATEQPIGSPRLNLTREPVGPQSAGDKGTVGDTALMDAVIVVCFAWALLFFLVFSLRAHNV